jgi:acyl-CoA synthetase (AMP-forming)/AMP-acid ligase II
VRGPWIVSQYFKNEGGDPLVDGWFPTGDVAKIDADGYMQITDRSKDVIKSGGEWIGSIDSRTSPWPTPAWPWRRASRPGTPSGTSARCWWW